MKLKDARETYYEASATTSTIIRQIGLAGVAFIWLLSGGVDKHQNLHITPTLAVAAILFLLGVGTDLGQYVWRTAAYFRWTDREQQRLDPDGTKNINEEDIGPVPDSVFGWVWKIFVAKLIFVTGGYVVVGISLVARAT